MAQGILTPRQRMINMMYLVLTAMLALNVSTEVLDSFASMENGLGQTIKIMKFTNDRTFEGFAAAEKSSSVEKVAPYKTKAEKVRSMANEINELIQNLKLELITKADGENAAAIKGSEVKADLVDNRDNTDIGTRLLVGTDIAKGKGYELMDKMSEYKAALLDMVKDDDSADGNTIKSAVEGMINLEGKTTPEGNKDWVRAQFDNTPVISDLAMLSKSQINVQNCEAAMLNYLLKSIGSSDYSFSDVTVAVVAESKYVTKGTPFEAEIYLAAFDPNAKLSARLAGGNVLHSEGGKITYKFVPSSVGTFSFKGSVEFNGPDGKPTSKPFEIPYQVGEPVAVVSATKMNVFYVGVDNPVDLSVSGVPQSKISASMTGGTLTNSGSGWIAKPTAGSTTCEISVSAEVNGSRQSFGTKKFRVKRLPTPIPQIQGISGRSASKGEVAAAQGIIAKMPSDFEFDLSYRISSFTVAVNVGGYTNEATSGSAGFTAEQKGLINKVKPGQRVMIYDIKASGPTGVVDLPSLDVKIR